jgi:colanic acid/amylovoran biosynthesis glycosyltransferase
VVLLDAQATGMPVIATRHCDIPEEVIAGQTGLLADEGDIAGLGAAIRQFYAMGQEEYNTFATRAAAHMVAEYDAVRNATQLRKLYDRLLPIRSHAACDFTRSVTDIPERTLRR